MRSPSADPWLAETRGGRGARMRSRELASCLVYLLQLAAALVAATSQSAPVWVSGDNQSGGQLQAASSSHEPSIVALDQLGASYGVGERRSEPAASNQTNAQVQFDPDEPARQPARDNGRANRRQDLNDTYADQANPADEPNELNNSSSQAAPHETFDNYLLNDLIRQRLLNSSSELDNESPPRRAAHHQVGEEPNQDEQTSKEDSLRASEPTVELEPSPVLIPMTSSQTALGNQRRKLHTAGTQYDFKDSFRDSSRDNFAESLEGAHGLNGSQQTSHEDADIAVAFAGDHPATTRRPSRSTELAGAARPQEFYNFISGGPRPGLSQSQDEERLGGQLSAGLESARPQLPRTSAFGQPLPAASYHFGAATDRAPTSDSPNRHFWTGPSLLNSAQRTRRENLAPWRSPAVRRPPSFNFNPQGFSHFALGEPQLSSSYWSFGGGGINHQAHGGAAFLRNYAGPLVYGGRPPLQHRPRPTLAGKPKRSLLGSLGSRINSWVSEPLGSASSGSQSSSPSLEHSFWSQAKQPQRARLRPAPASWQKVAANYYLLDQPPAAGSNQIRFPPVNFYPTSFGFGGAGHVRQPTVAPAPSSLDKFYDHHAGYGARLRPVAAPANRVRFPSDTHLAHQSSHHLSRYAAANTLGDSLGSAPSHMSRQQQPAGFVPVVAVSVTKTSPAPRPGAGLQPSTGNADDEPQSPELSADLVADYLDLKTGRLNRNNRRPQAKQQDDYGNLASGSVSRDLAAFRQPSPAQAPEQTTTVKSAIFGYLPQDAQKPLMQAISTMLPLTTGSSSNSINNNNKVNHLTSASDAYVNQVDQVDSSAASSAMLPAPEELLEEPPSLLLQLQANHFAQNDIAHPFGQQHQRPKPNNYDGLYSLPSHLAALQLVQADPQALMNPLLSSAQPLLASASEHNPLLAQLQHQHQARPSQGDDASGSTSNSHHEEVGESSISKTGKKRSSEFFASAGQLLLSALPLLLAPTLGLMFASGPTLPVARYQAPGGGGGLTTGSGHLPSSIPGNYINGQVSQSVPAHMFTPNPPIYLLTAIECPVI